MGSSTPRSNEVFGCRGMIAAATMSLHRACGRRPESLMARAFSMMSLPIRSDVPFCSCVSGAQRSKEIPRSMNHAFVLFLSHFVIWSDDGDFKAVTKVEPVDGILDNREILVFSRRSGEVGQSHARSLTGHDHTSPNKSSIRLVSIPAFLEVEPVDVNSVEGFGGFVWIWASRYLFRNFGHGAVLTLGCWWASESHPYCFCSQFCQCCRSKVAHTLVPNIRSGPGRLSRTGGLSGESSRSIVGWRGVANTVWIGDTESFIVVFQDILIVNPLRVSKHFRVASEGQLSHRDVSSRFPWSLVVVVKPDWSEIRGSRQRCAVWGFVFCPSD